MLRINLNASWKKKRMGQVVCQLRGLWGIGNATEKPYTCPSSQPRTYTRNVPSINSLTT